MLNREKYAKELEEVLANALAVSKSGKICTCTDALKCNDCMFFDGNCKDNAIKWLNSKYEEPILTKEEKDYLSAVIKPFRDKVQYIAKYSYASEWITIKIIDDSKLNFPFFERGTMYKGMKEDKEYTLKELGL